MKVIVIGSGVIGVTTAHYLALAGAEVTVLDQNEAPAMGASFANAGSMTSSRSGPWASPRTLFKAMQGYFADDAAFRFRPSADPQLWTWLFGFAVSAFSASTAAKRKAMIELGLASAIEREAIEAALALEYGPKRKGLLTLYHDAGDFDRAHRDIQTLRSLGIEIEALDTAACRRAEPAVAWDGLGICGGLLARDDTTADCRSFTLALADRAAVAGVRMRHRTRVQSVRTRRQGRCEVVIEGEALKADAVIVAAGLDSIKLVRPLGIRLPIYPVKGYSISVEHGAGPQPKMTVAHEAKKVFVSPLNGGLRAAGIADITGFDSAIDPARVDILKRTVAALYPQTDLGGELHAWTGLRAMTHDGPPLIFGIPDSGIWINAGHGSLGWTFACGAAKMTCDLVTTNRWEPENPYFGLARRWHD